MVLSRLIFCFELLAQYIHFDKLDSLLELKLNMLLDLAHKYSMLRQTHSKPDYHTDLNMSPCWSLLLPHENAEDKLTALLLPWPYMLADLAHRYYLWSPNFPSPEIHRDLSRYLI